MFGKKSEPEDKKALEKLVKDNFCGKQSVVGCPYHSKVWCEKTCGFYVRALNRANYWTR